MIRNLKGLALGFLAMLMQAFAPAVVQAESPAFISAGKYPAIIDGEQEGQLTVFTRGARTITCEVADLHAEIASAGSGQTITAFPIYENCHVRAFIAGIPATVTMNSCHFLFYLTADASNTFTSISDLVCEPGDVVEIHVYNNHADHTAGTSQCTYTFGPQSGKTTIELTNKDPEIHNEGEPNEEVTTPGDWITADINIGSVFSTRPNNTTHGHGTSGFLSCGSENHTTGTIVGQMARGVQTPKVTTTASQ